MVITAYTVPGCRWETADRGYAFATVLAAELNNHTTRVHAAAAAAPAHGQVRLDRTSVKRPERPVMKEDTCDQEWKNFSFEWGNYKTASGNTDPNTIRMELQFCCDPALRGRLLHTLPQLLSKAGQKSVNDTENELVSDYAQI